MPLPESHLAVLAHTLLVSAVALPVYSASMRPTHFEGPAMRLLSWNVASLRAMLTKVNCCLLYQHMLVGLS